MNFIVCIRGDQTDSEYLWTKRFQAGDVMEIRPDTQGFGVMELSNPDWRIVNVQGVTLAQVQSYLNAEAALLPSQSVGQNLLRRRASSIDWSAMVTLGLSTYNANFAAYIADDTRATPIYYYKGSPANIKQIVKAELAASGTTVL